MFGNTANNTAAKPATPVSPAVAAKPLATAKKEVKKEPLISFMTPALIEARKAQEKADRDLKEGRSLVVASIKAAIVELGIKEAELFPKKSEAKYRNTDGQEWSGKGKAPKWAASLSKEALEKLKI